MSVGIGIIGAGVMGADHALTVSRHVAGATLVAISDPDGDRVGAAAKAAGARRIHADARDLIEDREVEAVLIASPDQTHAAFVLACLAKGKPVLCEKPLAPTEAECLSVIAAEVEGGRRLVQVGFMRRFDPFYADMRKIIEGGSIGRPLLLHCAHRNVSAPDWFTSEMAVTNSAVHEIDIIRWLVDQEIVSISALRSVPKHGGPKRDPIMLLIETDGGIVADVEVFIHAAYGYDIRMEAVCEEGTIDLARPQPAEVRQSGAQARSFPPDWRGRFGDAYRTQLQAWVRSLHGEPVGASAWDGYVATAVADRALQSLNSGAPAAVQLEKKPDLYRKR